MSSLTPQAKSPGAMPVRKRQNNLDAIDVLVFLIPCLQFVRITLIGVLNGSDLMMLAVFLYLVFRGRLRIATPVGKWTLVLCSLWLASQCVTDIVRHSAFADYARGWSSIGLTLVSLAALWTMAYGRPRRLVLYGWGLVVGGVLYFFINPNELMTGGATGDAWKFGLAYPLNLGVFLFASRKECRGHWPITLAVIMGIINLVLGSRALGGICLAVALYLFVTRLSRRKSPEVSRLKAGTVMALAASILLSVVGVMWVYGRAAGAGILGQDAQEKYEQESSGKYGVLVGGRPELLAEIPAIYDSPILGHGSWAKQPIYLVEERRALQLLGYEGGSFIFREQLKEGLIPAHSYFFQAWVDSGILGAVFWGWVFLLAARVLLRTYPATAALLPVVSLLAFMLLWDIPFSPYGTPGRISFPYTFVMLMTLMDSARRNVTHGAAAKKAIKVASAPGRRPRSGPRASGQSVGMRRHKLATVEGLPDPQ
jgi:O-antigen ligase